MAFGRGKAAITEPAEPPRRRSLVASAIRTNFSDLSWNTLKWRDETWQRELWRYYDLIPEFSFASRWVGQCCSRVRIYVAKVDELGRVQGETKEPRINALADSLLGGPASKAEALRAMGINLTVAGECYVVGRPNERIGSGKDEWYILSPTEMRRIQGSDGIWYWAWDMPDGMPFKLDLDKNVVTRVWTPHPQRIWCADSPSRSCQMILRELEQLTKYVFSQIDSRLINAGVFVIPNNLDLPNEENTTNSSESLMYRFATAASASLRGEGTALGVLPHIIESDNPDGFQYKTFESELSKQAMELRKEAIERLGVGMDMPPEVLSGLGSGNHWCLSMDTEIYSRDRGWVKQDELAVGDQVMTLDHEVGTSSWQPVQSIYRADVVDEPMVSMESASHSSLSTEEHRWPIIKTSRKVAGSRRRWTTSGAGFSWMDRIPVAAVCDDLPQEAKHTDDFVRLVAAYTSDGYLRDNGSIRIAKFAEREIVELRRVLRSVFQAPPREYEHPTNTATGIAFCLSPAQAQALLDVTGDMKSVSLDFIDDLTLTQLNLFLDAMIELGDGVIKGNARTFFQVEPSRLDALERAALLAGFTVRRGVRAKNTGFSERPLHWISVSKSRPTLSPMDASPQKTTYTGTVWCPTTANGTWLARRNGKIFYTGNSSFLIDGYGIKVHIEPLMNRIVDALTKAYLYPALEFMGKDPERYTYAFDTSPLQVRTQRLQDALNLYEKGELSGEALREAGYFKESDAPTVQESSKRFIQEILLRDPQMFQNQAVREASGIPDSIIPQTSMIAPTAQSMSLGMGGGGDSGGGSGPPPPPAPPTGIVNSLPPPIPDTLGKVGAPPKMPGGGGGVTAPPTGIQASANPKQLEEMGVIVLAEATVRRALELAGKKSLDRKERNRWPHVPFHELHTRIKVLDRQRAEVLLAGAWTQLDVMTKFVSQDFDTEQLQASLHKYCVYLLLNQIAHDPPALLASLQADGVIHA